MPNEAKQRFVDLTVNEISVVDTPANEVEFLVLKRAEDAESQEEENMGTQNTAPADKDTSKGSGAVVVPVSGEVAEGGDVSKALAQVADIVKSITGALGIKPEATEVPAEKAIATPRDTFKATLEKSGVAEADVAKALTAYDAANPPAEAKTEKAAEKPAEPAKAETTPAMVQEMVTKSLADLFSDVSKGKKMTPKREEQMKSALTTLTSLLEDMTSAAATPAADDVSGGMTSLTKSIQELAGKVTTALGGIQETTKKLEERVEGVEKARLPSTSLSDDETADGAAKPVEKSLWSGVL